MKVLVDNDIRNALVPLPVDAKLALEEKLSLEGCTEDFAYFVIDRVNIQGDGHHRREICDRLKIKYGWRKIEGVTTKADAIKWVKEHQYARRNLTPEEIKALKIERLERVAAARAEGKSIRTIAEAEGKSKTQIERDMEETAELGQSFTGVPPGTPVKESPKTRGQDGKEYSATAPKPTAAPKPPKSGTPVYDDRIIDALIGKLTRAFDDRANARGKGGKHKNCIDAMNTVVNRWNQWQHETR